MITELETTFWQFEHELVDLQYWVHIFRSLRAAFGPLATSETILEQIRNPPEDSILLLPFHLALSHMPETSLSDACGANIVTFEYLFHYLPISKLMLEYISIYILRYWRKATETQAFALRNPQMFKRELLFIEQPTFSNIAALLLFAADATGTRLGDGLRQSLADAAYSSSYQH